MIIRFNQVVHSLFLPSLRMYGENHMRYSSRRQRGLLYAERPKVE